MILLNPHWKPPGTIWPFYAQAVLHVECCLASKSYSMGLNCSWEKGILPPIGFERRTLPKNYHPMVIQ